jgi:hypothetical protein
LLDDAKPILASRTVWANLFGLALLLLGALGFDTAGADPDRLGEAAAQIGGAACFIASTVFRVVASRRLA